MTGIFEIRGGLKQGCPLSCLLFNIALEWVMRQTPREEDPVTLTNGLTVDRLGYADDVDLMGEQIEKRDRQVTNFQRAGKRISLEINEGKTKVMKVARERAVMSKLLT